MIVIMTKIDKTEIDNNKIYRHANIAIPYLLNIGYNIKNIYINSRGGYGGKPDIITKDGKEWEVKISFGCFDNWVDFSKRQINKFKDDVQILIYRKIKRRGETCEYEFVERKEYLFFRNEFKKLDERQTKSGFNGWKCQELI